MAKVYHKGSCEEVEFGFIVNIIAFFIFPFFAIVFCFFMIAIFIKDLFK